MFGFNFGNKNNDADPNHDKNELEQFFEDEDWDIGQKGGEVDKDEREIDWSNYDFMQTFDDMTNSDQDQPSDDDYDIT